MSIIGLFLVDVYKHLKFNQHIPLLFSIHDTWICPMKVQGIEMNTKSNNSTKSKVGEGFKIRV
jgi:hypothetical protein